MKNEAREPWWLQMDLQTLDSALGTALSVRPKAFTLSKHINILYP